MTRSYDEINEKIRKGKAVVLTAEEVSEMAKTMTPKEILEKVDVVTLSLIHISEPTRLLSISYAVFCLKKKKQLQEEK